MSVTLLEITCVENNTPRCGLGYIRPCIMTFARVYHFTLMPYVLNNNLSVMSGGFPISLG